MEYHSTVGSAGDKRLRGLAGLFIAVALLFCGDRSSAQTTAGAVELRQTVTPAGSANIAIPLPILPGGGGLTPSLGLVYTGQSGDSPVGNGWAVTGASRISRGPRTRRQDLEVGGVELAQNDAFYLDGDRLVPIDEQTVTGMIRTEFRKAQDDGTVVTATGSRGFYTAFIVETKAGLSTTFVPGPSISIDGRTAPVFYLPHKTSDRAGNYIVWEFRTDGLIADLSTVRYTGYDGADPRPPFAEIRFIYEPIGRPQVRYVLGVRTERRYRLKSVQSRITDTNLGPTEGALSLDLQYDERPTAEGHVLRSVQSTGFDGTVVPPVVFDYRATLQSWTPTPALELPITLVGAPNALGYQFGHSGTVASPRHAVFASFDSGSGTIAKTYVLDGSGWREDTAKAAPLLFVDAAGRSLGTILFDVDSDGLTDLLQAGAGVARAYRQTDSGWVEIPTHAPVLSLIDAAGTLLRSARGDLDGDNRPDLLISQNDGTFKAMLNTSRGWQISDHHALAGVGQSDLFEDVDCNGSLDWVHVDQSAGVVRVRTRSALAAGWGPQSVIHSGPAGIDTPRRLCQPKRHCQPKLSRSVIRPA